MRSEVGSRKLKFGKNGGDVGAGRRSTQSTQYIACIRDQKVINIADLYERIVEARNQKSVKQNQ